MPTRVEAKTRKRIRVVAGDVFAVPLDAEQQSFGYIRAYQDVDVGILPVISKACILSTAQIPAVNSVLDVFLFQDVMKEGRWPRVGNLPFADEASAWAPARKQVAASRPEVKMVVFRGHFIPAAKFGQYDELPLFEKFDEDDVIKEILRRADGFLVVGS
jgi:hypothetical protein